MGPKSKKLSVDEAPTTRKGVFVKSPPERRQMKDIAELNTHVGVHSPDPPQIHTSVTIPVLVLYMLLSVVREIVKHFGIIY